MGSPSEELEGLTRLPAGQAQRSQVGLWPGHWQPFLPMRVPPAQTGTIRLQLGARLSSRASAATSSAYASGSAMAAARAVKERRGMMARNFMVMFWVVFGVLGEYEGEELIVLVFALLLGRC